MAMLGRIWLTDCMVHDVASELGVHRTTVARWLKAGKLPTWAERLLDITHNGNLGAVHPDWENWTIDSRRGDLVTPVGTTIDPGTVMAYPYNHHLLTTLRHRVKELESELAERPVSHVWLAKGH